MIYYDFMMIIKLIHKIFTYLIKLVKITDWVEIS